MGQSCNPATWGQEYGLVRVQRPCIGFGKIPSCGASEGPTLSNKFCVNKQTPFFSPKYLTFNARERPYFISISSCVSIAYNIINTISDYKYYTV